MATMNCLQCGDALAPRFAAARMLTCPSCGTTMFLEDQVVRLAGQQGVLHELPSPVVLGTSFRAGRYNLLPVGLARYDYGRGTWDEYWCVPPSGEGWWVSVGEGEIAVQRPIAAHFVTGYRGRPALGTMVSYDDRNYEVQESDRATLIGWRGELPEPMVMGEAHDFVNCTRGNLLLSGEFWGDGEAWFAGEWLDPWDLRVRA